MVFGTSMESWAVALTVVSTALLTALAVSLKLITQNIQISKQSWVISMKVKTVQRAILPNHALIGVTRLATWISLREQNNQVV